jgi:malonyl-CoA O-methyltransferase
MICKEQVVRRFGKMSTCYDDYARVQKQMAQSLQQLAANTGPFTQILEIGCGTGFFTRLLATLYPQTQILATDISPGMLAAARRNLSNFSNIQYALEDGESLKTQETFDLIISNAAFQWFNDYTSAYNGFYSCLKPGGYLIYATFGQHTFCELHTSFATARRLLNIQSDARHGQSFPEAASLQQIMNSLGLTNSHHSEEEIQEYFPTVKDFLLSVKKIGANNARQNGDTLVNRQLMFSMMRHYEENFREQDKIYATYHVIYGIGRKESRSATR